LFKKHTEFSNQLEALKAYLKFIPIEKEINGYFQNIPGQIFDLLCKKDLLPVVEVKDEIESNQDTSELNVSWKRPNECILLNDNFLREVLTPDLLKKTMGFYYLHTELAEFLNAENMLELFKNLGVKTLSLRDLIKILNFNKLLTHFWAIGILLKQNLPLVNGFL
jgi:hypothetical protein